MLSDIPGYRESDRMLLQKTGSEYSLMMANRLAYNIGLAHRTIDRSMSLVSFNNVVLMLLEGDMNGYHPLTVEQRTDLAEMISRVHLWA